ncbi:MAG: hypothetical protein WCP79_03065 [Bacillota bacterium]
MLILDVFAKIGDVLQLDKFNPRVLRKLTVDSDLSRYSNIQVASVYYGETSFEEAIDEILK